MDTACPLCRDPPTRADRHSTKIRRWVAAQRPADHAQRAHPHYIWVGLFGSIFFTAAAWLQLEEAVNGDVADIITLPVRGRTSWRWLAWKPHNAGYSSSLLLFAGTILFNFNTQVMP